MDWLFELHKTQPVAYATGEIALVCLLGMALGSVKFRGLGIGTAGVLFAGLFIGHFTRPVDPDTLNFVKEFGLVLFVFALGLQLGPGFFATLRQQGLRMNGLAAANVLLAAILAPFISLLAGFDPAAVLGIFAGASVNIPALGAATQTLSTLPNITSERLALPALACAVTYPTAIAGSLGVLLLIKRIFHIDPAREAAEIAAKNHRQVEPLERRTLVVNNRNLEGVQLGAVPGRIESCVTISRVRHDGETRIATDATVIRCEDCLTVVGTRAGLDQFERVVGHRCDEDLVIAESGLSSRFVVVTDRDVLGKRVSELNLGARFGIAVTRIRRAGLEMSAVPGLQLQYGDQIQIVGADPDLDKATAIVGNSIKELNEMQFVPFFIGIVLGVILGTVPIAIPGLPQPVRLSLAGGPLIVALLLGRIGRIGRQVWHMPVNTNLAFREFGISLFFAAAGLNAGEHFFATAFSANGLQWLLVGVCVTVIPLVLVGIFARGILKMNFMDLSGLLAGSTTNPPALTFATNFAQSEAPAVAYATVYPLTTVLRILAAQTLAIILFR